MVILINLKYLADPKAFLTMVCDTQNYWVFGLGKSKKANTVILQISNSESSHTLRSYFLIIKRLPPFRLIMIPTGQQFKAPLL
jgi:hypothetical protein